MGIGPCGPVPPPPLECTTSSPPLVAAVFITPKGVKSPGSRRIGVIGALVCFLPSETVGARGGGGYAAARPLDWTRVPRMYRGVGGVHWDVDSGCALGCR